MNLTHAQEEAPAPPALHSTVPAHEFPPHLQDSGQVTLAEEPAAVTALLVAAKKQNARHRRLMPVLSISLLATAAAMVAIPHTAIASHSSLLITLIGCLGLAFSVRFRKTTSALAAVDDVNMVGPLIDRLRIGSRDRRTRRILYGALLRILPRLRASDESLLTAGQKSELARHLGRLAMLRRDKELQLAILRALEQIGDARAIPVVRRIAHNKGRWWGQAEVRAAAEQCLPFLVQRADAVSAQQTLLRGSTAGEIDSSQLLHPADGVRVVDPQDLLRAGSFEED